jgi:hypothetical protein
MRTYVRVALAFAFAMTSSTAMTAQPPQPAETPAAAQPAADPSIVVGPTSREKIEQAVPAWVAVEAESKPDAAAVSALSHVPPGADVTVYLGTWCGDSRRELSRLFRLCDELSAAGALPFALHLVGVDRTKQEPAAAMAADHVLYLPTLIVRRGGQEVGRIVETSPASVEADLLSLLDGRAHGVLSSSRPELATAGPATQP